MNSELSFLANFAGIRSLAVRVLLYHLVFGLLCVAFGPELVFGQTPKAATKTIATSALRVDFSANKLSLSTKSNNKQFFAADLFGGKTFKAIAIKDLNHSIWGKGQQMILTETTGNLTRISVHEKLPFVMMQRVLFNSGKQELKVAKDQMIRGAVTLNSEMDVLRTLSTAGLKPAKTSTGGYVYMAVANSQNNNGVVVGWLSNDKGSGVVLSEPDQRNVILNARIDYGDLRIPAGKSFETEILVIGYHNDVRFGLESYADALAKHLKVSLPPMPTVYCTWYHGGASDEKKIAANADFAYERLAKYGFNTMQIDDFWQLGTKENGPRRNFMNVRPEGPYPKGMKPTADYIKSKNFNAGIWYMPFAGTWNDPFWKDKEHLFLREGTSESNYFYKVKSYADLKFPKGQAPFEASWGGTCLDLTHPETQEYVRFMADRLAKEWGFNYFKMDGLWTGTGTRIQYINSEYKDDDLGMQIRHNPAITPIQAFANGLDIINQAAGKDVFILGCSQTQNMRVFGPSLGRVDAMRVGPDNGANPRSLIRGPQFSSRVYFLNKRVWYNDPDPVYVRKSFPEEMAKTSVSWSSLTGSMHTSSFQYAELPPERLDILIRSMPSHSLKTVRPVDFLENDPARVWLLSDQTSGPGKYIVGLFNWNIEKAQNVSYAVNRLGIPAARKYVGFDYWANKFIPPFTDSVSGLLPPGGCKIISLKPVKEYPQVVSTSRHLTQGIMDLKNERWDPSTSTLSGTSDLIGGETYELRLVSPGGDESWTIESIITPNVSRVTTKFEQQGNTFRVSLLAQSAQKVNWRIKFRKSTRNSANAASSIVASINGLKGGADMEEAILSWDKADLYSYRIIRNGVSLGEVSKEQFVDKDIAIGKTYRYGVQGKLWDGQWSTLKEVEVKIPEQLILPPIPAKPSEKLTVLTPVNARKDQYSVRGDTIKLSQPVVLTYSIPAGSKRLVSSVSMNVATEKSDMAKVKFSLVGDVLEMGEPPVVLSVSPLITNTAGNIWHFDVELDPRMKQVQLVVEPEVSPKKLDVNWINAGFTK